MKIILATDGSESARAAVDFLLAFPFPSGSDVRLMTVLTPVLADADLMALDADERAALADSERVAMREAEYLLAGLAAELTQAGWASSTLLLEGQPAGEIVAAAGETGADLVVVGSHGLEGIRNFLLGSVSDHVLRYAPCSVLVVRRPARMVENGAVEKEAATFPAAGDGSWRLLLAYDDSLPAKKAADFCASLPLSGAAAVEVLSVLPLIRIFRQDVRQQLNSVYQEKKRAVRRALERVEQEVRRGTEKVSVRLTESPDVAQAIVDAADGMAADLIVLGNKGKGAVERFLLGSVTSRVAHHATCSVLAVRDRG